MPTALISETAGELRNWKGFAVGENNPFCLQVEHIFHVYSVKEATTFLAVCGSFCVGASRARL